MAIEFQVTFDCADPRRLATFWAAALHYEIPGPPGEYASWDEFLAERGIPEDQWNMASAARDPDDVGPRLYFQQVPEGKRVKNRVHLDLRCAPGLGGDQRMAALEREAERLAGLGATRVERHEPAWNHGGFIVMTDPEGNEFCVD